MPGGGSKSVRRVDTLLALPPKIQQHVRVTKQMRVSTGRSVRFIVFGPLRSSEEVRHVNKSTAPVHNNQRDGLHRQAIPRGKVAYEPNSLGGGCPFQAGAAGFVSFPQPIEDDKLRGKPEKFAEHYAQATLFYESQTEVEKAHIVGGFRFELSKVTVPAIRERMLASLVNVSTDLASKIAAGLGLKVPEAMPKALAKKSSRHIRTAMWK